MSFASANADDLMATISAAARDERRFLEFIDDELAGNSIQFVSCRNCVDVSIENPLAGSTESGFGAITHFSLSRERATQLLEFFAEWLNEGTEKTQRSQQAADSSAENAAHMEPK